VCRTLEFARVRGVTDVSFNYAGLAHLVRNEPCGNRVVRMLTRAVVGRLGRPIQMQGWCASTKSSHRSGARAISFTSLVSRCQDRYSACSRPSGTSRSATARSPVVELGCGGVRNGRATVATRIGGRVGR
jgi:hypothetical protein